MKLITFKKAHAEKLGRKYQIGDKRIASDFTKKYLDTLMKDGIVEFEQPEKKEKAAKLEKPIKAEKKETGTSPN